MTIMTGNKMSAQVAEPVRFKVSQEMVDDDIVRVKFEAEIAEGWHVYSTGLEDGPVSASVIIASAKNARPCGDLETEGNEISTYDDMFGTDVRYFEGKAVFMQNFKVKGKRFSVKGELEFGACNDTMCLPPSSVEFAFDQSISE